MTGFLKSSLIHENGLKLPFKKYHSHLLVFQIVSLDRRQVMGNKEGLLRMCTGMSQGEHSCADHRKWIIEAIICPECYERCSHTQLSYRALRAQRRQSSKSDQRESKDVLVNYLYINIKKFASFPKMLSLLGPENACIRAETMGIETEQAKSVTEGLAQLLTAA